MGVWCGQMSTAGWAGMVAVWAAVVALAVWAVCRLFPTQRASDARTVLDARLASGQIDLDTYHRVREELDGASPVSTGGSR